MLIQKYLIFSLFFISLSVLAQISNVEGIEPIEGVDITKSKNIQIHKESIDSETIHPKYLYNPPPDYPKDSISLNEQGQVVLNVLISADGMPLKVELYTSSGFVRLDESALDAAMRWRFVPGKRGGVAEAMWYRVPISFNLKIEDSGNESRELIKLSESFLGLLRARVKPNITFSDSQLQSVRGNPAAEVEVIVSPSGQIMGMKLTQSSGNAAWDQAVLKAIQKTGTLPRDENGKIPTKISFVFRPWD